MEAASKGISHDESDGRHDIVDPKTATSYTSPTENFDNTCECDITGGRHEGSLYDTPPDSFSDAVSPMSSRKRGVLQAESLGLSPTGCRNRRISTPTPLDRADPKLAPIDVANLPTSTEDARQRDVREPLPAISPPIIAHRAQSSISGSVVDQSAKGLMDSGSGLPQGLQPLPYGPGEVRKSVPALKELLTSNPYEDRADEIGPTHDIADIGHIGDLLAPPGWTVGSAPFEPEKLQELYNTSRNAAKDDLATAMKNLTQMPAQEKAKIKAAHDEKWRKGLKLDKFLKEERIKIWKQYIEHKAQMTDCDNLFRQALGTPQVMYPPTETSIPYQHDTMRPQLPALFQSRSDPVGVSAMQDVKSGRSVHVGFTSPTMLDPYLATDSYEAIISRYKARRAQVEQELQENENILSSFMNHYGNRFSNGPISPGIRSCLADQQTDASSHECQGSASEYLRPLTYISPTHTRHVSFSTSAAWDRQLPSPAVGMIQPSPQAMVTANGSRPLAVLPSQPDESAFDNVPRLEDDLQNFYELYSKPAPTASASHPTVAKKTRARKKPTEKPKPWYQAQLEGANLPVSTISHDAMQAGIEYGRTGILAKNAVTTTKSETPGKTPKKRHEKKTYDPAVPFRLSKDASKKFMALYPGLVKELPESQQTTSAEAAISPGTMTYTPYQSFAAKYNVNFVFPSRSQAQVSTESPIGSAYKQNAKIIKDASVKTLSCEPQSFGTPTKTEYDALTEFEDDDSELSTLSSKDYEDPTDANFEIRSTRGKANAMKNSVTAGVKRKSDASTATAKRPRINNTMKTFVRSVGEGDHMISRSRKCTPTDTRN